MSDNVTPGASSVRKLRQKYEDPPTTIESKKDSNSQKLSTSSSEIEKLLKSEIKNKDITDLSTRDARYYLDKFLLRSSGIAAGAVIKGTFVGADEVIQDFALMINDKVGGKIKC